eukprot:5841518-Amphidinium_carterae.1
MVLMERTTGPPFAKSTLAQPPIEACQPQPVVSDCEGVIYALRGFQSGDWLQKGCRLWISERRER